jgi:hypothetical protein
MSMGREKNLGGFSPNVSMPENSMSSNPSTAFSTSNSGNSGGSVAGAAGGTCNLQRHRHHPHYSLDGQTIVSAFDWEPRPLPPHHESTAPSSNATNQLFGDSVVGESSNNTITTKNGMKTLNSKVSADTTVSLGDRPGSGAADGISSEWDRDDIESIPGVNPEECVISSDALKQDGWFDCLPEDDETVLSNGAATAAVSKRQEFSAPENCLSDAAITTVAEGAYPLLQQSVDMVSGSSQAADEESQRGTDDDMDDDDGSQSDQGRFREYQACQWSRRFQQLVEYKNIHGHVCVPHTSRDAPSLGRWVKRQRYQYKLWQDCRPESTMTQDRINALESIGFVWESHEGTWETRFNELERFYQEHGHSNVPSNHSNNKLATWVKYQRRQFKLQKNQKNWTIPLSTSKAPHSSLTADRIKKLQSLGFEWQLRRCRGGGK